jgi:GNAT superfamily N-acetyltransferase
MIIRPAVAEDVEPLARIWFDGWHDAHAALVPAELTALRTLGTFAPRLETALGDVRVAGPAGAPVGFSMLKGDELYQLYVASPSRGSGIAAALLADGEARLAARGFHLGWLACAIGNDRAARFYEKNGWRRTGTIINDAETLSGPFPLEVWRYEKALRPL